MGRVAGIIGDLAHDFGQEGVDAATEADAAAVSSKLEAINVFSATKQNASHLVCTQTADFRWC